MFHFEVSLTHTKLSFPLKISSVNVTTVEMLNEKFHICAVLNDYLFRKATINLNC